ncbi:MAG: hypothetical protein Kow0099_05030 [Candidatus Abyssubacteria bacterium]
MAIAYMAFSFAFRITMTGPDTGPPDLTGDLTMNYDIFCEIIGAKSIIDGTFDMYVGRYSKDAMPPDGVAISYPPLTAYLQTPIVYLGLLSGWKLYGMPMIIACGFPYIIASALCCLQAGTVLKKVLKVPDERSITATVFLLMTSSLMFWVVTYSARFEFLAALFLLLAMSAASDNRYGWAGICLGLSLMTKQIALPAVLVFMTVFATSLLRREIPLRSGIRFFAGIPVSFVMLVPFWLASPPDLWVGLFNTPAKVPILQVSFVNALLQAGKLLFAEDSVRRFLMLHSNTLILAACMSFITFVVLRKNVRMGTNGFCALAAIASFFFPVLAKYPEITRYAAIASVFVVIWGASRRPGFPYDALWFVVLQSFVLNHVPVIWRQYVGLVFYSVVCIYMYVVSFRKKGPANLPARAETAKAHASSHA